MKKQIAFHQGLHETHEKTRRVAAADKVCSAQSGYRFIFDCGCYSPDSATSASKVAQCWRTHVRTYPVVMSWFTLRVKRKAPLWLIATQYTSRLPRRFQAEGNPVEMGNSRVPSSARVSRSMLGVCNNATIVATLSRLDTRFLSAAPREAFHSTQLFEQISAELRSFGNGFAKDALIVHVGL